MRKWNQALCYDEPEASGPTPGGVQDLTIAFKSERGAAVGIPED